MFFDLKQTYIISEIGINHDGNMDLVRDLIFASKDAGADIVKFQKRTIDLVYTQEVLNSPRKSRWGTTVREQKEGLEFNAEQYQQISTICERVGVRWCGSAWDLPSVDFLVQASVPFIKIPSALATSKAFLKACAESKLPLVLSTGMCDLQTINKIVWFLEDNQANLQVIMHCTSTYPTALPEANLQGIQALKDNFRRSKYVIGWSGHDELVMTGPLAVACGARVVERHLTIDKNLPGSDQKSSLEPHEFADMVRKIRIAETALGDGNIKVYESELPIISKLRPVDDFK